MKCLFIFYFSRVCIFYVLFIPTQLYSRLTVCIWSNNNIKGPDGSKRLRERWHLNIIISPEFSNYVHFIHVTEKLHWVSGGLRNTHTHMDTHLHSVQHIYISSSDRMPHTLKSIYVLTHTHTLILAAGFSVLLRFCVALCVLCVMCVYESAWTKTLLVFWLIFYFLLPVIEEIFLLVSFVFLCIQSLQVTGWKVKVWVNDELYFEINLVWNRSVYADGCVHVSLRAAVLAEYINWLCLLFCDNSWIQNRFCVYGSFSICVYICLPLCFHVKFHL